MADVHALLLGLLRPALPGVTVQTLIPADMLLPFVLARRSGGAALDGRLLADDATVDVQVWAAGDPGDHAARVLAEQVRRALAGAWRAQTVVPGAGSIARYGEETAPVLLNDDTVLHGVYRYQATYQLLVRPPR